MKHALVVIFSALLLSSCQEVIDIDTPPAANKLVVEGVISTETDSSFVRLTRTLGYFDNTSPIPTVENATVTVNGVAFTHVANGIYKAPSPYSGSINTRYNLNVVYEGKTYTSTTMLEPGFDVDTIYSVFKPASGFIPEGYAVKYEATDNRPRIRYTYFKFGFKNDEDTRGKDSIFDLRVFFDNKDFPLNAPYEFELPLYRFKEGDSCILIFRSIDEPVFRYLSSIQGSGGNAFFGSPPANLPTNITGDALGLFAAYDVKRYRMRIIK
ncbi:MAG: DUF4249 domain-containing protein [Bacteroidota bacterium]|jgi:hypothetical protein